MIFPTLAPLRRRPQLDLIHFTRRMAAHFHSGAVAPAAILGPRAAGLVAAAEVVAIPREERLDGGRVDGEERHKGLADGPDARGADVPDVAYRHDAADDGGGNDEDTGEEDKCDQEFAFEWNLGFPEDRGGNESHEAYVSTGSK